jgi:type II secretory pathway pseudopilin PulG
MTLEGGICRGRCERAARGYVLIAALLAVLIVALATAAAVSRARTQAQREKELQLLWVGDQYRRALRNYHAAVPPTGRPQYPVKLEDLLDDRRFPTTVRYLRELYPDPFTSQLDWVLERQGDQIVGLHSRSLLAPVRRAGLGASNAGFEQAGSYAQWRFMASDPAGDTASAIPVVSDAPPAPDASPNASPNATSNDTPQPPPPNPYTQARAQCFVLYGKPSLTCRGPNFAMGADAQSCAQAMAQQLEQCIAAAAGTN